MQKLEIFEDNNSDNNQRRWQVSVGQGIFFLSVTSGSNPGPSLSAIESLEIRRDKNQIKFISFGRIQIWPLQVKESDHPFIPMSMIPTEWKDGRILESCFPGTWLHFIQWDIVKLKWVLARPLPGLSLQVPEEVVVREARPLWINEPLT